ncbi:MAG: aminotransferase class III-fold pyridoxal phosphate-dependent enzyme, partial [Caldilineaceae bacterium]|nr:aminotransferase class III-fold pyridoxal phosphate-dependent enzyme [Caldilineaceae bacterium]
MTKHDQLYQQAQQYLPGGVSASFRLNKATGRPLYLSHGDGARLYDVDGQEYIDMCVSHGASLLGHNHPAIKAAYQQALDLGILCSYETEHQTLLAKRITEMVPCAEMVRFAGGGGEATAAAARTVRGFTGREVILNCGYRGWPDVWAITTGDPGVPEVLGSYVATFQEFDLDHLQAKLQQHHG